MSEIRSDFIPTDNHPSPGVFFGNSDGQRPKKPLEERDEGGVDTQPITVVTEARWPSSMLDENGRVRALHDSDLIVVSEKPENVGRHVGTAPHSLPHYKPYQNPYAPADHRGMPPERPSSDEPQDDGDSHPSPYAELRPEALDAEPSAPFSSHLPNYDNVESPNGNSSAERKEIERELRELQGELSDLPALLIGNTKPNAREKAYQDIADRKAALQARLDEIDAQNRPSIKIGTRMAYHLDRGSKALLSLPGRGIERFKNMETKGKVAVIAVGVLSVAAAYVAIKSGTTDQLLTTLPATPDVKPSIRDALPTPDVTEGVTELPEPKPNTSSVAAEISPSARKIKPGEGWYNTLQELNIPKKKWDKLLNDDDLRRQLIAEGVAYEMPNGDLGLNATPNNKIDTSILRDIQHEAGIDTAPEPTSGPEIEKPVTPDITPSPSPSAEITPPPVEVDIEGFTPTEKILFIGSSVLALVGVARLGASLRREKEPEEKDKSFAESFADLEYKDPFLLSEETRIATVRLTELVQDAGDITSPEALTNIVKKLKAEVNAQVFEDTLRDVGLDPKQFDDQLQFVGDINEAAEKLKNFATQKASRQYLGNIFTPST